MDHRIIVVTPTIGREELADAIQSVIDQTVTVEHLIVIDGPEYEEAADRVLSKFSEFPHIKKLVLPYNTGKNLFYGHRVIATVSHMLDHEYVFLLDDDNWFDDNHVESLVLLLRDCGLDWGYSFRKVWTNDKTNRIIDNSISIGSTCNLNNQDEFLVDTSSYAFTGDFIGKNGWKWHDGWGADRRFFQGNYRSSLNNSTKIPTLNYRLGVSSEEAESTMSLITNRNEQHVSCSHWLDSDQEL